MKIVILNKDGTKALCLETIHADTTMIDLRVSIAQLWDIYIDGVLIVNENE